MPSLASCHVTARNVVTLIAAATLSAACESARDRPTGLTEPLPATTVTVVAPQTQQFVPADSTTEVQVEARGLLQAVEVVLTRNTFPDTLASERQEFGTPQEFVNVIFVVRIPDEQTGAQLQFRAVAEDILGGRHTSDPVIVVVIECDVFPITCAGL